MKIDKFKKLEDSITLLETIARNYKEDDGDSLITYSELEQVPIGTEVDLKNGVRFVREYHPEKKVYFITNMDPAVSLKKKAVFGKQWHDCIEIVDVLDGHMIEMISKKTYKKGATVLFPRFLMHKPASKIRSKLGVEFLHPSIKEKDFEIK